MDPFVEDRTALIAVVASLVVAGIALVLGSSLNLPALSVLGVVAIGAAFVFRAIWQGTAKLWLVLGGALCVVIAVAFVASRVAG